MARISATDSRKIESFEHFVRNDVDKSINVFLRTYGLKAIEKSSEGRTARCLTLEPGGKRMRGMAVFPDRFYKNPIPDKIQATRCRVVVDSGFIYKFYTGKRLFFNII